MNDPLRVFFDACRRNAVLREPFRAFVETALHFYSLSVKRGLLLDGSQPLPADFNEQFDQAGSAFKAAVVTLGEAARKQNLEVPNMEVVDVCETLRS